MRPKNTWGKNAVFADILRRLGLELAEKQMWDKYLFLCETTGEGCELAEKVANLLFTDETVAPILKELDEFYGKFKTITKD